MVQVLDIKGAKTAEAKLPSQFNEPIRPDLIKRAFHAEATLYFQPKGNYPWAGMENTAEYYGRRHAWRQTINTGRSRLPREKIAGGRSGRVLQVPHAVKGRRAHPPKPYKTIIEKINLKEKMKAVRSAMAATTDETLVKTRGHKFTCKLPLVLDNSFESVKKTKDVLDVLTAIGVQPDIARATEGRKKRSGVAGRRRGGYRQPKSVLIVFGNDKGLWKASRNLPGVDVVNVADLTAEKLAPGGVAGRLTIWTQDALQRLSNEALYM